MIVFGVNNLVVMETVLWHGTLKQNAILKQ